MFDDTISQIIVILIISISKVYSSVNDVNLCFSICIFQLQLPSMAERLSTKSPRTQENGLGKAR